MGYTIENYGSKVADFGDEFMIIETVKPSVVLNEIRLAFDDMKKSEMPGSSVIGAIDDFLDNVAAKNLEEFQPYTDIEVEVSGGCSRGEFPRIEISVSSLVLTGPTKINILGASIELFARMRVSSLKTFGCVLPAYVQWKEKYRQWAAKYPEQAELLEERYAGVVEEMDWGDTPQPPEQPNRSGRRKARRVVVDWFATLEVLGSKYTTNVYQGYYDISTKCCDISRMIS